MGATKTTILKDKESFGFKSVGFVFKENVLACWKCKKTLVNDVKGSVHGSGLCKVCESIQRKSELSQESKVEQVVDYLNGVLQ